MCLAHQLSSHEIYSHYDGPAGKRKRLSLVSLSLLKNHNAILVHIEEQYSVFRLHVHITKKKQAAQLSGLFTEDGLPAMIERVHYFFADTVFPFAASYIDRSPRFMDGCDLTRINEFYKKMVNRFFAITTQRHGRRESWQVRDRRFGVSRTLLRERIRRTAHLAYIN